MEWRFQYWLPKCSGVVQYSEVIWVHFMTYYWSSRQSIYCAYIIIFIYIVSYTVDVIWFSAHRNGLNLGSYEKWMIINRFDQQHAGTYTCRPIPPQNVQSPSLSLALGREYNQATKLTEAKSFPTHMLSETELKVLFWCVLLSGHNTETDIFYYKFFSLCTCLLLASIIVKLLKWFF